ncbi:Ppx/GppA family phosphatase [Lactobacillus sp. LC28-10]|uniref:Ppx/GppA family phosphatase n=1 Tax=Secundilactobacillus angelensis TaxID=2722706 RepID=A0ABX1KY28_9LACO|nr:Ppx/GppA family phosphatase [Secundilactobacillus angelensis]MCH5463044.1 exopolyphosphatase [Secundilactobacillus angelensis]NLR18851.1 Ppx/GppA family phosphatase [Secundilactobacillus angelensis]
MDNLVIVDLGSNSVRMTINEIRPDKTFREVARYKEDSRISEGMGDEKELQEPAIQRTLDALRKFKTYYEALPHLTVKAITTAAVRQARNQAEFLKRVEQAVGLKLDVLSGDDEAYYDYLGVKNRLRVADALMLDVGGASLEMVHIQSGKESNLISIPFGAVNLSEQFHLADKVFAADFFNASIFLRKRLRDIWWLHEAQNKPLILLGGANRSLARMSRRQQQILHVEQIHGYQLTSPEVFRLFSMLLSKSLAERQEISGLEPDRADIIVGGIMPLVLLLQMLDSDRVIFSESGVREGIIHAYLNHDYN